jgi:multidrug transporter EmrE-like cation transporter
VSLSLGLLLCGVVLNAAAQLLLKAGTNSVGQFAFTADNVVPVGLRLALEPYILAGIGCYLVSLVVWLMALSRTDVSIAYPMLSLGFVINAAAAWFLLGESVSALRLGGVALIVLGVVVVARS